MAYYTNMQGIGINTTTLTLTHGLGFTPASLVARPIIRQAVGTATGVITVVSLGTNLMTVVTVGTLTTCDVEVQLIHSLIA